MRVLGWAGVAAALTGDDDLVLRVVEQLPPFFVELDRPDLAAHLSRTEQFIALEIDGVRVVELPDCPDAYRAFASRIELHLIERHPDLVAVHAGVVAIDGRAVVLPGRSGTGKSTLVRALLGRGASYLSDEYALLDSEGQVHPYPRLLSVRDPETSARVEASSLGADTSPTRLPVHLVASVRYDEAIPPVLQALSPGLAVLRLLDNCVPVRRDPPRALATISLAMSTACAVEGTRHGADATADLLLARLREGPSGGL